MAADPDTVTINVSLPRPLKRYVDNKVSSGVYGSVSEFVCEAIREKRRRDQEREEAKILLTGKLLEGLDSGKPVSFIDSHFEAKKRALVGLAAKSGRLDRR